MEVATAILVAFVLGLVFHQFRLPSLVGYLLAGFLLQAIGVQGGELLDEVSHVGVLLLLFSIGLKLRLKSLIRPEAWGAGLLHLGITTLLFGMLLHRGSAESWQSGMLLAAVFGFSSTVLAAKVLEERRELRAFHGRTAIGILIVQDLVAIGLLGMLDARPPDYSMLLVFALPLLRPVLYKVMDYIGHDELFILYGLVLALVLGGLGFEKIGLSAELGALLVGSLLAGHRRAVEMSGALWGFKELFLIGFFLQIGLSGAPTLAAFSTACLLTLGLAVQAGLFFFILVLFRLRARSAFLAALSLATYSEFGLIVAKLGVERGWLGEDWLVTLAIAVAMSFAIAAPVNRVSHRIYARLEPWLKRFEFAHGHPDEQPISIGKSDVLIMGMGRVGSGAYDFFRDHGMRPVGLDSDPGKVERNLKLGRRVLYADAEDPALWHTLDIREVRSIVLAMPDFDAKKIATRALRKRGYRGFIVATSNFPEEADALAYAGANHTANSFYEVGSGLASHIVEQLKVAPPERPNPLP